MAITLYKRLGQSSELSDTQIDSNWNTIESAINNIQSGVGVGSVTFVSASPLSPLFTTNVANASTIPSITFTAVSQAQNKFYASPTGGSGVPSFRVLDAADITFTIPTSKGGTGATSFTASRVIVSNGSSNLASSTVTSIELSYLSGVSSAIQSQLNAKESTITILPVSKGGTGVNASSAGNGKLLIGNGSGFTLANLTAGSNITIVDGVGGIQISATGGMQSLNGLTDNVQLFTLGNSGTDINISSSVDTHTFNFPDASEIARGVVTTGTQKFAGEKTFETVKIDGSIINQVIFSDPVDATLKGSAGFEYDESTAIFQAPSIKTTLRVIQTNYNDTLKTSNYSMDVKDNIIYTEPSGGSIDVDLPDLSDPEMVLGTIYIIKQVTASNNTRVAVSGAGEIDDFGLTEVTITGVKGWVEIQAVSATKWRILTHKLS